MASIVNAFSNLVSSILEVFGSILQTLLSALQSVGAVFTTFLESIFDLVKSLFSFLLSNIVLLIVLAGAVFAYGVYQQSQGRRASAKKTS